MLTATRTKFALAVGTNLGANGRRAQVCDIAQKRNRTFTISIFHFAIRGTHPAERLNATLNALGYLRAFAGAQRIAYAQCRFGYCVSGRRSYDDLIDVHQRTAMTR